MTLDEAIDYIFDDSIPPDGIFKIEAQDMYRKLQHRKKKSEKMHKNDFDDYKIKAIAKARRRAI